MWKTGETVDAPLAKNGRQQIPREFERVHEESVGEVRQMRDGMTASVLVPRINVRALRNQVLCCFPLAQIRRKSDNREAVWRVGACE